MDFKTDYQYQDRETKSRYVWLKYQPILNGSILDVGADVCYLKQHLPVGVKYIGIGLGGNPDHQVDLEKEKIPFDNNFFDCVICLDVLEHLDNIHDAFDELCRVSKRYVIISLPNPWKELWSYWRTPDKNDNSAFKFYGLPTNKPDDRHKWFFSTEDAERFIKYRANKNQMNVIHLDFEGMPNKSTKYLRSISDYFTDQIIKNKFNHKNFQTRRLWIVLERKTR